MGARVSRETASATVSPGSVWHRPDEELVVTVAPPRVTEPLPPLAPRAWLRYDVVKRVLDRLQPQTALEIGCGQGSFGARLASRARYLGVEPDDTSFAIATRRIRPRGGEVIHGFHTAVPAGSTYDFVCAFEVLEHIEDDEAALADWAAFVRPGGHLVLSVPAFQRRFGPMDTHAGHFRRYDPDLLSSRLTRAGLSDIQITVYGWPLGYGLEAVRNRIDARKLQRVGDASMADLTGASGRTFQPSKRAMGTAVAASVAPFSLLQRLRTRAGIGLVAVARRPDR